MELEAKCRNRREDAGVHTFLDFFSHWYASYALLRKSASSLKRDEGIARNYLIPRFGDHSLDFIEVDEIEEWLLTIKTNNNLSTKSCNNILGLFKKVLTDGMRWGYLLDNPAAKVSKLSRAERDYRFWSIETVQEFLARKEIGEAYPGIYSICKVALYTGMRRGEIQGLMWDCVDINRRQITVKRSYDRVSKTLLETTKSRKIRRVPINESLDTELRKLRRKTLNKGYVLPWLHPDRYYSSFQKICRRFNFPKIAFHDLRHTFASHFMMAGGNIYDLKRILGHSSVTTTEIYAHHEPDFLNHATNILKY